MLEMLKERKEALEAQGTKGFTLMEMLIVIAIIAILIAIAIPIFTAQLERAGEATDAANIRADYATAMAEALTNPNASYSSDPRQFKQTQEGWQNTEFEDSLKALNNTECTGMKVNVTSVTPKSGEKYKITYDKNDGVKILNG